MRTVKSPNFCLEKAHINSLLAQSVNNFLECDTCKQWYGITGDEKTTAIVYSEISLLQFRCGFDTCTNRACECEQPFSNLISMSASRLSDRSVWYVYFV